MVLSRSDIVAMGLTSRSFWGCRWQGARRWGKERWRWWLCCVGRSRTWQWRRIRRSGASDSMLCARKWSRSWKKVRAEHEAAVQDLNQLPDEVVGQTIRPAAKKTKRQQEADFNNLVYNSFCSETKNRILNHLQRSAVWHCYPCLRHLSPAQDSSQQFKILPIIASTCECIPDTQNVKSECIPDTQKTRLARALDTGSAWVAVCQNAPKLEICVPGARYRRVLPAHQPDIR